MRWAICALGLVAGTGCDLIFSPGGAPGRAVDAADGDAIELDAAVDADQLCAVGTDVVETIGATADVMIVMSNPTQAFGSTGVANIGADLRSRGLFRFPIRTDLGPPAALDLVLQYAAFQHDCGSRCGSCAPIERAGGVHAAIAISSWVEAEASWNLAQNGSAWSSPGADGDNIDRSLIQVSAQHVHGEKTRLRWTDADATGAWSWVMNGELSVLVVPEGTQGTGTVIVSTTKEGVANECVLDDRPALLVATFCE